MRLLLRIVAMGLLISLAAAATLAVVSLYDWGGRVEASVAFFGDPVWVAVDGGRPRVLLLLLIPGALLAAAFSLRPRRSGA